MSKRLGKDQRAKFLAEFEQNGKLSDPNYYAIKDKNGKVQIRHVKNKSESSNDEEVKEGNKEGGSDGSKEEVKVHKQPKDKTL